MKTPDDRPPAPVPARSFAFRLGRFVQAFLLALALLAVVLRLMQLNESLTFRYGGF